jgi:hypothetical protein
MLHLPDQGGDMRLVRFLLHFFLLFSTTIPTTVRAQKSNDGRGPAMADALAGSWRLVSVETIRPGGEIIYPFYSKHPTGLLIYDRLDER